MTLTDRQLGSFIGLFIGDALGAPVEFQARGTFEPVTTYRSGGPFNLTAGMHTDDGSMALALAQSIIERGGTIDVEDTLEKYRQWYEGGRFSATGHCFDIGNATRRAITAFIRTGEATPTTSDNAISNGSMMRLAPAAIVNAFDAHECARACALQSTATHGHPVVLAACAMMGVYLYRAYQGMDIDDIFAPTKDILGHLPIELRAIDSGYYEDISGSGYAPDCLASAIVSIREDSDDFESAVLNAVNIGGDADTTAAVCGQMAGAIYGVPEKLVSGLYSAGEIRTMASNLIPAYTRNLSVFRSK